MADDLNEIEPQLQLEESQELFARSLPMEVLRVVLSVHAWSYCC